MEADAKDHFVASLDLGTNTFNLSIAKASPPFSIEYRIEKGVFLGKGGLAKKIILPDASKRAQLVLSEYSKILSKYNIKQVRCVATEAIRNATNAKKVLQYLEVNVPFSVETIAGEKEAELVYKGVKSTGLLTDETSLIVDIGGGSVEFIIGNSESIYWKKSYKIGTSRALESYPLSDPPLQKELEMQHSFFQDNLEELDQYISKYKVKGFIGTAGSFDAWRKMIDRYKSQSAICKLEQRRLLTCIEDANLKSEDKRLQIKGMEKMRVSTIVPAGILVAYLLDRFNFNSIHQCSYSLAEGVLWEMINE